MSHFVLGRIAVLVAVFAFSLPALDYAQSSPGFQEATLEVSSEWTGQDRGDGSGSYHLKTRLTDGRTRMTIQHELAADRGVDLEVESSESLVVLEDGVERARAASDPAALGAWADPAVAYAIPFDLEFSTDSPKTYRPRDRQVADLVRSAVPDAKVSTRAASDGRTTAVVEIPGLRPVSELASQFVAIRKALHDAEVGLAKLQIKGQAETSQTAEVGSTQ